ncbi:MAG TPA: hypothetical protein VK582_17305 [Pyrinomonadaceae bacterium]|nr:hypothetical protein [Pyrinomonadaceae bacterium]
MEVTPNKKRRGFHEFGTSKVVGVIDDKSKADAARVALTSIGITDVMIEVFCGLEGERNLDLKGESHGFLDHISRIYEHVRLVDGLHMDRYEKELLAGHCVIQVYTGDSEAREQAKDMLKASGAHFINAYTAWTTEVLVP